MAQALRAERETLTARWLERIAARVALDESELFPSEELLDHVPLLIDGIADYLENPTEEITADIPVVAKAMELGDLRFRQGFDPYQILKEYELLGGVLFTFLARLVDDLDAPCTRGELLQCGHRVFRAVSIIQQATTMQYLRAMGERIGEREERLRGFNRMVSHELKNRIGAIRGAQTLLEESWLDEGQRERFLRMIGENADSIQATLENLTELSRVQGARQHRNVLLPAAAAESVRGLRAFARSRGVRVEVGELPPIEVNAAAVELMLSNYISNAIKYSDPDAPERWVRISGRMTQPASGDPELVVEVRDNGLGVPPEARKKLFQRFFRAHETVTGVEGTGLGLSIVRDTAEQLGGRAWAEFPLDGGTVFAFCLPSRRAADTARGTAMPGFGDAGETAPQRAG